MWREIGKVESYYYKTLACRICREVIENYPSGLTQHLIRNHSFSNYWSTRSGHFIGYKSRVIR